MVWISFDCGFGFACWLLIVLDYVVLCLLGGLSWWWFTS